MKTTALAMLWCMKHLGGAEHDTPYPFTTSGEITCSDHIELGRGVFFNPVGFTDESYVGTPLNKAAADIIKLSRITPNVPYRIKPGMDLSEAREIGLKVCDEQIFEDRN